MKIFYSIQSFEIDNITFATWNLIWFPPSQEIAAKQLVVIYFQKIMYSELWLKENVPKKSSQGKWPKGWFGARSETLQPIQWLNVDLKNYCTMQSQAQIIESLKLKFYSIQGLRPRACCSHAAEIFYFRLICRIFNRWKLGLKWLPGISRHLLIFILSHEMFPVDCLFILSLFCLRKFWFVSCRCFDTDRFFWLKFFLIIELARFTTFTSTSLCVNSQEIPERF